MRSVVFAALLCLFAASAKHGHAEYDLIAGWQEQVFPSYLIATAAMKERASDDATILGDRYGSFGVSVTAPTDNASIHVTIQCDGYAEPSEFVGVLPTAGVTYRIYPKMRYRFDQLGRCKQATPAIAVFKVQLAGGVIEEESCTVTMRSINDCPFALAENGEVVVDLSHVFAAYVNEQHPFVDKLLREALDIGMVDSFTGYQANREGVLAQVYALWDLLVTRDVRYSNITTTAAVSSLTCSQHVRLLEETVNNTQANCVDGSVLLASLLRKIGIDAILVLTDDHCYLAFWTDKTHEQMYGLETTMISLSTSLDETPQEFAGVISEDMLWEHSWASFVTAVLTGSENLTQELNKPELEVSLIDVNEARAAGVLPIPFTSQEQFVAVEYDDTYEETMDESDESDGYEATEYIEEEMDPSELAGDSSDVPADPELSWDDDESNVTGQRATGTSKRSRSSEQAAELNWE